MLQGFRFSIEELSGSLADMGSMVPFILGAVLIADFKLAPVLLMFAAAHIVTGLYYKIPMSVQPMKAIGALVIAGGLTHGQAVGTGLVVGVFFMLMALSGTISSIAREVPKSIIRGTQLGMALIIAVKAIDIISQSPVSGMFGILLIMGFFIAGREGFSSITLLGLGFIYGILFYGLPHIAPVFTISVYLPTIAEIINGTLIGATSQIPLTFVNAILGTSLLVSDLYSKDIKPGKLAVSTGIMNLVSAPLGGLPMCHGSSGVAAHYKFGARTGGSNIIMGVVLIMAAIFIPAEFLVLLPGGITGALLLFAGYELGNKFRDSESLHLTLMVAAISLFTNIGIGFISGMVLFLLARKIPILNMGVSDNVFKTDGN
jgi:predicted benzoate:H+ symporter BenE